MKKLALVLVLSLVSLTGCAGLPGFGNPDANSTQPATNVAQTVGNDQAAVPSSSFGGQGFINNHFASESDATVRLELLKLAADQKWTAEQIAEALKASSSAPQVVNITGDTTANGGDSSAIGSGTGGGIGATGAGQVQR